MFTALFSRIKSVFQSAPSEPAMSASSFLLSTGRNSQEIPVFMRTLESDLIVNTNNWEILHEHVVTKVQYRKQRKANSEHEYLLVTVVDDKGMSGHLLLERTKDNPEEKVTDEQQTAIDFVTSNSNSRGDPSQRPPMGPLKRARKPITLASASSSVSSVNSANIGTPASLPRSSQDSTSKPFPARDLIHRADHWYHPPPDDTSILVFEPGSFSNSDASPSARSGRINLLQLVIIANCVYEFKPQYQVLRSQCYWFSMTVFGILMLQGGHLKSYPLHPSKKAPEPEWKLIKPVTEPELYNLPVPKAPEDLEATLKEHCNGDAGKKGFMTIMRPCIDDIWTLHQLAEEKYRELEGSQSARVAALEETAQLKRDKEITERENRELRERTAFLERELASRSSEAVTV
ncbi:hypothetical protein BDN70DRAFT_992428 [Pholiota conissans]|uniref:Uncharacterized protein n=1 Tax=Pholiota conissans TaxID=109636 RepID=A0A9P6D2N0_9AGAR|nr:hypothetical protein BDN70DRAFT_992428 [Pholiota conissans]